MEITRVATVELDIKKDKDDTLFLNIEDIEWIPLFYLRYQYAVVKSQNEKLYGAPIESFVYNISKRYIRQNYYNHFIEKLPYYNSVSFNIKRKVQNEYIINVVCFINDTIFIDNKVVSYIGVQKDFFKDNIHLSTVNIPENKLRMFIDYDFFTCKEYKKLSDLLGQHYSKTFGKSLEMSISLVENLHEKIYNFSICHSDFFRSVYELQDYTEYLEEKAQNFISRL